MGKLTTLLAVQYNSNAFAAGRYYAIRSNQMKSLVDSSVRFGYSTLVVNKLDGSQPDTIVAASAASAVRGQLNTANTTNSVNEISVSVLNDAGATVSVNLNPDQIHLVFADPLNIARSYVQVEDFVGQQITNYHATITVQAVVALANS
jgi:hypothetical protein